eukprot:5913679-Prymnesium_polylepis.1
MRDAAARIAEYGAGRYHFQHSLLPMRNTWLAQPRQHDERPQKLSTKTCRSTFRALDTYSLHTRTVIQAATCGADEVVDPQSLD